MIVINDGLCSRYDPWAWQLCRPLGTGHMKKSNLDNWQLIICALLIVMISSKSQLWYVLWWDEQCYCYYRACYSTITSTLLKIMFLWKKGCKHSRLHSVGFDWLVKHAGQHECRAFPRSVKLHKCIHSLFIILHMGLKSAQPLNSCSVMSAILTHLFESDLWSVHQDVIESFHTSLNKHHWPDKHTHTHYSWTKLNTLVIKVLLKSWIMVCGFQAQ